MFSVYTGEGQICSEAEDAKALLAQVRLGLRLVCQRRDR